MPVFEVANDLNYAAQIIRVDQLVDLPGLDNLKGLPMGGYMALVSKDTPIGSLMVVFPAESQLSEVFARDANLYRHTDKNADPEAKAGYLEDNRRVRAIRLKGNLSSALAIEAEVLNQYTGNTPLEAGIEFDTINGVEICRKYAIPNRGGYNPSTKRVTKLWRRADKKFMPEHFDTAQLWRVAESFKPDDHVTVTQKVHGTSVRLANTIVKRRLRWWERALRKAGVRVQDTELDVIGGSRRVIKDPENTDQEHYYTSDIWTQAAKVYAPLIPEHVVIYGELVGWADEDTPIQRNYTYDVPRGHRELYVYRVAVVAPDGGLYDLSWNGVQEFCAERGLRTVPLLWQGPFKDFVPELYTDRVFSEHFPNSVPLSEPGTVDEGVCVRREGVLPLVAKVKSPKFFEHESALADEGVEELN